LIAILPCVAAALGLGPVAVLPDCRRRGIAAALVREGLKRATYDGWAGVFVLGDPNYYRRFGFESKHADGFESAYAGPHFMALPLTSDELPLRSGPSRLCAGVLSARLMRQFVFTETPAGRSGSTTSRWSA
jgi:predicted N-acetyltransferase YhbS